MNPMYRFVLGILGVWRVTHLLNAEDGPGGIFVKLRTRAGSSIWGELLDCFYCLSIWVALPFAFVLGGSWPERLLLLPALSAAAILLERWQNPQMVEFREDPAPPENREGNTP
jgi:hypothetical protein